MSSSDQSLNPKHVAVVMDLHHALPWHHEPYHGIRAYAERKGWAITIDPHMTVIDGRFDPMQFDGVVGRVTSKIAAVVRPSGTPLVTLTYNTKHLDLPGVRQDTHAAARMAAEHFLSCGYRRVGLIAIEGYRSAQSHQEGVAPVLAEAGLPAAARLEIPNDFEEGGVTYQIKEMMTDWLQGLDLPAGVLVSSTVASRYLAVIAKELGLRVPEDVGIVTTSGDQVITTSYSPTLSSIETDLYQQGYEAAALLDELMDGQAAAPLHRLLMPKRIIVRESTDVFLCEDPLVSEAMHAIAERVHQPIGVDELAESVGMARRTLERKFEETLGRSVHSEIRRIRAEHIQRLLIETGRSISDIAFGCGFDSASHFARFFKREVGVTPSAYRDQMRRGDGKK